jgi:predicted nucleic acid-binding Zn ribbon protein
MKDTKSHPKSALDVLQGLLDKGETPLAHDFKRYRLKLDWEEVVGSMLASRCTPVGYANGILYIWVVSSSWMNQLLYVRKELLKKVNDFVGSRWAKDIRFTQDKRDVPKDAMSLEDPKPSP